VGDIILQYAVFILKMEDVFNIWIELDSRQRLRDPGKL
jgi:hypothetical protein